MPMAIATISARVNFSLIRRNAIMAAKIGPVVKLIQLESVRGMRLIAAYCIVLEIILRKARLNTSLIDSRG